MKVPARMQPSTPGWVDPRDASHPARPAPAGLRAAHVYLAMGWSVIPVMPGDKRPLITWAPYQSRLASPTEVEAWFRRWPGAGIAVVTGAVSGVVVIDIDPQHGGELGFAQMAREHGALPPTVEARSGGGGRHFYLRHPVHGVRNRAGIWPGVDVRGDGGYIIAPPSVHASGACYAWIRPPGTVPLASAPQWLAPTQRAHPGPRPVGHWRSLAANGAPAGSRNDSVASLAGHLLARGVDPEVVKELLLGWNAARCRPPLDDQEVARTVASILRTHRRKAGADNRTTDPAMPAAR